VTTTLRPTTLMYVDRYPSEYVPNGPTFHTCPSLDPSNMETHSSSPGRDRIRPTKPSTPPAPATGIGGPATVSHKNDEVSPDTAATTLGIWPLNADLAACLATDVATAAMLMTMPMATKEKTMRAIALPAAAPTLGATMTTRCGTNG
jgi:hypothetical protein